MIPHNQALERIRAEYLEMPGLSLTVEQVSRLCGVDRSACEAALQALVSAQFLSVRHDGSYARSTEGAVSGFRYRKADLRPGIALQAKTG